MSYSVKKSDNTGRVPMHKAESICSACRVIGKALSFNHECKGHMMLNNSIKFPNNIGKILDFNFILKSRKYTLDIEGSNVFMPEYPNTYPQFCVTDSGNKYGAFGDNFIQVTIRTFLCAIANYTKAVESKATYQVLQKKKQEIVLARYNMDKQAVNFNHIDYSKLDVRWVSGICDLYNIGHSTLEQVINKSCITYKLLPYMVTILNSDYTFSADLVLNALSLYINNRQLNNETLEKYQILKEKLFILIEGLKTQNNIKVSERKETTMILSDRIKNIIEDSKILIDDIDKIAIRSYNEDIDIFINNLYLNILINIPHDINLLDDNVLKSLRFVIMYFGTFDINKIDDTITNFTAYFFQTFPNNIYVEEKEYLQDVPEVTFHHIKNAIISRRMAITSLLDQNYKIIPLLSTYDEFKEFGLSDHASINKYIKNNNVTFKELQSLYMNIVDIIKKIKKNISIQTKKNAKKYLKDLVLSNLHQWGSILGMSSVAKTLLQNVSLTPDLFNWYHDMNPGDCRQIIVQTVKTIIQENNIRRINAIRKNIECLMDNNDMINNINSPQHEKYKKQIEKNLSIIEKYKTDNSQQKINFKNYLIDDNKAMTDIIEQDNFQIDINNMNIKKLNNDIEQLEHVNEVKCKDRDTAIKICVQYKLLINKSFKEKLLSLIDNINVFPMTLLSVVDIDDKKLLNILRQDIMEHVSRYNDIIFDYGVPKLVNKKFDHELELMINETGFDFETKIKKSKVKTISEKVLKKISERKERESLHRSNNTSTRSEQRNRELENRKINRERRSMIRYMCKNYE